MFRAAHLNPPRLIQVEKKEGDGPRGECMESGVR
jgi:hypothetical protein